jgi:hypothetical protein
MAGGMAGRLAMDAFTYVVDQIAAEQEGAQSYTRLGQEPAGSFMGAAAHPETGEPLGETYEYRSGNGGAGVATASCRCIRKISETLFHHEMSGQELRVALPLGNHAVAAAVGAAYGVAVEYWPDTPAPYGMAYGSGLITLGAEVAAPTLGLAEPPTRRTGLDHLRVLGAALIFGATAEYVRKGVRQLLD